MATGEFKIEIPASSPPIEALTITLFEPGSVQPQQQGGIAPGTPSNWGTTPITGPAYNGKYGGSVAAHLTRSDLLKFQALVRWQQRQIKGLDAALTLDSGYSLGNLKITDETTYLDPEPAPHSRTLVAALTPAFAPTYRYGYGVLPAVIVPGQSQQLGATLDGEAAYLVPFTWVEV